MKYIINTTPMSDGRIIQTVELDDDYVPIRREIVRSVIDTKEKQVHDALVQLGWTPPFKERRKNPLVKTYHTSEDARIRCLARRKTDVPRNDFTFTVTGDKR